MSHKQDRRMRAQWGLRSHPGVCIKGPLAQLVTMPAMGWLAYNNRRVPRSSRSQKPKIQVWAGLSSL